MPIPFLKGERDNVQNWFYSIWCLFFQLIMVPGYTQEEKIAISKRHLLPKQLKVCRAHSGNYLTCFFFTDLPLNRFYHRICKIKFDTKCWQENISKKLMIVCIFQFSFVVYNYNLFCNRRVNLLWFVSGTRTHCWRHWSSRQFTQGDK